jgi:predicted RNA-binding Zn-ribbon protein involved in translation (DUF1610 family)
MAHKLTHYFTNSVAALLTAFAAALFLSNLASAKLTQPRDPLFAIPMDLFFGFLGLGALVVGIACIFVRQLRFKLALVLWFATNLFVYWFGLQWQGVPNSHGYFGSLAHTFNLSIGFANILFNLLFLYLLIGSAVLLFWDFRIRSEEGSSKTLCAHCGIEIVIAIQDLGQKTHCQHCQTLITLGSPQPVTSKPVEIARSHEALVRTLKIFCTACGGHIEFPTNFFGERIPCPHCKALIILQKAPGLKMSCLACDGRIEFPARAVGEKISCPHCNADITLKKQA